MIASSLLNRLLIFAIFEFCHADIFDSTSSFFTRWTDETSLLRSVLTKLIPPPPLVGDATLGLLSATIANGFVSLGLISSSLILSKLATGSLCSLTSMSFPASTKALNSRLMVVKFSVSLLATDRFDDLWLMVSHTSPRLGWYRGGCGGGCGCGVRACISLCLWKVGWTWWF
ncbi:hypothetical protein Hanom_Chr10g00904431 [Helianthus anomalus]